MAMEVALTVLEVSPCPAPFSLPLHTPLQTPQAAYNNEFAYDWMGWIGKVGHWHSRRQYVGQRAGRLCHFSLAPKGTTEQDATIYWLCVPSRFKVLQLPRILNVLSFVISCKNERIATQNKAQRAWPLSDHEHAF